MMGLFRRKKNTESVDIKALASAIINNDRERHQPQSVQTMLSSLTPREKQKRAGEAIFSSASFLSNEPRG